MSSQPNSSEVLLTVFVSPSQTSKIKNEAMKHMLPKNGIQQDTCRSGVSPPKKNLNRNLFGSPVTPPKNQAPEKKRGSPALSSDTVVENEGNDNIRYSPSIKRRPGKYHGRNNIPPSLSPLKNQSPRKVHTPRTKVNPNKASPSPSPSKITDYFPKSIAKETFNKCTPKNRLSLSLKGRSKLQTRAEDVPFSRVEQTNSNFVPAINLVDNNEGFKSDLTPPVNASSEVDIVDLIDSYSPEFEETLKSIDWNEISRIETSSQSPGASVKLESPTSEINNPVNNPSPPSATVTSFNSTESSITNVQNGVSTALNPNQAFALSTVITGSFINYLIWASKSVFLQNIVFREEDFTIAESFNLMPKIEQDLYSKLFLRINSWIRLSRVDYSFVEDLDSSLAELERRGFVTTKFQSEELGVLLDLLQLNEVKEVCKQFCKHCKGNKKEMIQELLKISITQKSLWSGAKSSIKERIKSSAQKLLKSCIKLTEIPREFFQKLVLTSSYAHFSGDERDRLPNLVTRFEDLRRNKIALPVFNVAGGLVFYSKEQFENYYESLLLKVKAINESEKKNWTEGTNLVICAKKEFECFLTNENLINILQQLPDFLRRFTGGYVYSGIISKGIVVIKKNKEFDSFAIECLELLLSQRFFHNRHRGGWYNELALIHENRSKNFFKAHEILMKGLSDALVDEISKRALSQRAEKLCKRKNSGINEFQKISLRNLILPKQFEPSVTQIEAKTAPKGSSGLKQMFIIELKDGKQYSSVEEVVIDHYKFHEKTSYSKALHDEGRLIINLALACFWDVIYCEPSGGNGLSVFHSHMQTAPLDWCTTDFYNRREHLIKEKVNMIKGPDGITRTMEILKSVFDGNKGIQSVVNWDILSLESLTQNMEKIQEFLECLKADVFANIADHLLKDYRLFRSGFPDLTLWDPATKKCLIVEVKGPADSLSHSQSFWLENLHSFGAHAEVCKVDDLHSSNGSRR